MRITRALLREWRACYTDAEIAAIVPVGGLTPLEVADFVGVPVRDRLWVLLREEVIPARELRLLVCKWVRQALALVPVSDPRSVAAVDVAERYARGDATSEQLDAARAAASAAASVVSSAVWAAASAASSAVWAAASAASAVSSAASAAAWAAWAAARAPASACARSIAWDAANAAQLADVRAVLAQEQ